MALPSHLAFLIKELWIVWPGNRVAWANKILTNGSWVASYPV
jgi:hypothetical protein